MAARLDGTASGLVVALVIASIALPAAAAADAVCEHAPAVALRAVAPDIWRVAAARGQSDASNAGVVTQLVVVRDGRHRLWLIGSGPTPAFGEALACAIRRDLGGVVSDLVNTRAAPELSMGNVAFPAARRWALPDVIATMRARCVTCLDHLAARIGPAGDSLRTDRIRVPSVPIGRDGAVRGRLGPFDWRALARAPGERALVLRLRRANIVVAQGLVWAGDIPDLRDTRSETMLASLQALQRFAHGALVLGEQGEPVQLEAVAEHVAYIDSLRKAVLPHLASGDVDGAAGFGVDLPTFGDRPGYAAGHALNVQRVWRELEPGLFR